MDAIGIDLGSAKCVMGVVKKGGIDIVLSDTSNRQTPVYAAFTNEERLVGEPVKNQIRRNFKNSIMFPTRFLGLNQTCEAQLKEEEKFITHKLVNLENKKIGFEVQSMGKKYTFMPEQILAFFLRKIMKFYQKAGVQSNELVISVPSYCTNVERQAYLDAAEIAGIKCLRTINESTAVGLAYGFFRKRDLSKDQPRKVVFVDFGHSKTTITVAQFVQEKLKVIYHASDRNLGARNMDYLVLDKLAGEFNNKYGADPRKNKRCMLRMFEAIEKMRKTLTSDTEAQLNIDCLLEEEDLSRKMSRDEFQNTCDPITTRFHALCKHVLEKSGVSVDDLHSVELVGDATRIPIIIDITKQVFGKECTRTLNSLECVARGAGLQAAMLSPLFSVSSYNVEEFNSLPVSISYQFELSGDEKSKIVTKELFPVGSSFPSTKTITFDMKSGGMDLLVHYSKNAQLLQGLPDQVAQYTIKKKEPKHENYKFILNVSNNIHQIPCLMNAELAEEWTVEEKIPIKAPAAPKKEEPKKEEKKEGEGEKAEQTEEKKEAQPEPATEQKYEIKTRKKSQNSNIQFNVQAHALPPNTRKEFMELENQLNADDRKFLDYKEARNDLESYTYDMKNNICEYGSMEHYIEASIKAPFLANLLETVDWLYGAGENAPIEELRKRYEDFRVIGEPARARYRFYTTASDFINVFEKTVVKIFAKAETITTLTDDQKKLINDKIAVGKEYFDKVNNELQTKKKHEDPSYKLDDLQKKIDAVMAECEAIFKAPPPKPKEAPKEEAKKEDQQENADAKADVDMKDEQAKNEPDVNPSELD